MRAAGRAQRADQLQALFRECCEQFGRLIAVDLFEHVLAVDQTKYWAPPKKGRPQGVVNEARDAFLRREFDLDNPDSLRSQAWNGKLIVVGGKLQLADPEKPGPRIVQDDLIRLTYRVLGFTSAGALQRRLKELGGTK